MMSSGKKALVQGVLGFGSPMMRVERAPTPVDVPSYGILYYVTLVMCVAKRI